MEQDSMSSDMPGDASDEKRGKRTEKHAQRIDVTELERRVHLAELHAREAEAEVRYMEAAAKRKALKGARKDDVRATKKEGRKRDKSDDED
jgi:hypothetical protein